ncbi:MAG: hypothetical protein QNJ73_09305 [Gammaproteobacteria bacterium]|nr:hypothetical protein [Gammaproteobacteria bacterium]
MLSQIVHGLANDFALDRNARRAAAELFDLIVQGEMLAADASGWQAELATDPADRRFLRWQMRHEQFHTVVFRQVRDRINPARTPVFRPSPGLEQLRDAMTTTCADGDYAASLVQQQIFLDGFGHVALSLLDAELQNCGGLVGRLRRVILAQEESHHEFGCRALAKHLREQPGEQERLQKLLLNLDQLTLDIVTPLAEPLARLGDEPVRPEELYARTRSIVTTAARRAGLRVSDPASA